MRKEIINIKGTKKGLVILVDSNKDFDELKSNLKEKIASSKGFFKGAKFTFNLDKNLLSLDKEKELEAICCEHGLIPNVEEQTLPKIIESSKALPCNNVTTNVTTNSVKSEEPSLLVPTGLRSGQKIHYAGNVTVLGDVNPGSEIVATGDIIVMGTLRGVAHAGAQGNTKAIIVAYRLEANQIRISDKIGCSPDNGYFKAKEPEIAYISKGQIEISKYIPNKLNLYLA